MLTIEVNGDYITWPEDFAALMMGHYKNHGVPFTVHRNCVHSGWSTRAESDHSHGCAGKLKIGPYPAALGEACRK
ncbi:MAG TPA: hypothetical protein VMJ66_00745 [Geobacteraceae bacterium]|nr:hypothetical protein [Geobacteraceae bacterium]